MQVVDLLHQGFSRHVADHAEKRDRKRQAARKELERDITMHPQLAMKTKELAGERPGTVWERLHDTASRWAVQKEGRVNAREQQLMQEVRPPELSPRARRLERDSPRSGGIFQRLYDEHEKIVARKEELTRVREAEEAARLRDPEIAPKSQQLTEGLGGHAERMEKEREKKAKWKAEWDVKLAEEEKKMTFRPETHDYHGIAGLTVDEHFEYESKRQAKLQRMREEAEKEDLRECSFKPHVVARSVELAAGLALEGEASHDRLYSDALRRQRGESPSTPRAMTPRAMTPRNLGAVLRRASASALPDGDLRRDSLEHRATASTGSAASRLRARGSLGVEDCGGGGSPAAPGGSAPAPPASGDRRSSQAPAVAADGVVVSAPDRLRQIELRGNLHIDEGSGCMMLLREPIFWTRRRGGTWDEVKLENVEEIREAAQDIAETHALLGKRLEVVRCGPPDAGTGAAFEVTELKRLRAEADALAALLVEAGVPASRMRVEVRVAARDAWHVEFGNGRKKAPATPRHAAGRPGAATPSRAPGAQHAQAVHQSSARLGDQSGTKHRGPGAQKSQVVFTKGMEDFIGSFLLKRSLGDRDPGWPSIGDAPSRMSRTGSSQGRLGTTTRPSSARAGARAVQSREIFAATHR